MLVAMGQYRRRYGFIGNSSTVTLLCLAFRPSCGKT